MKEYNWNYERDPISILEYVSRISEQISDVCLTMRECDGDMWLSEVRNRITFIVPIIFSHSDISMYFSFANSAACVSASRTDKPDRSS